MGIGKYDWGETRYDTLVDNGSPDKRLDVAILGDGYAAHEMGMFNEDVDKIIGSFHDIEPMKSYAQHFNFHRVNVISRQSGVDDRWQKPAFKAKSALGAHFSFIAKRRLVGWDWRVRQVARRSGVPWDSLLVVVNTPRRGGATAFWLSIGYASRNSNDFPRIMVHEAGHSIAKLIDEYTGEVPDIPFLKGRSLPNVLPFANASLSAKRPPWKVWIEEETVCPTPFSVDMPLDCVGAVEGAFYTSFGTYRPTRNCMMRQHNQAFCPVCREQWIKRIYKRSPIADDQMPANDVACGVNEMRAFGAMVLKPEYIKTLWRVRTPEGEWQDRLNSAEFKSFTTSFPKPGLWTVECKLEDHNPMLRKPSVIASTRQKLRWAVRVK